MTRRMRQDPLGENSEEPLVRDETVGESLRTIFAGYADEPVPEHLIRLAEALESRIGDATDENSGPDGPDEAPV